ncbi:MAG TPA: diacylglycerol kinase family protein [Candidatus Limnocylindrales bacterium]
MAEVPYRRVHVVINPASGKDEPILNVLNDTFRRHGVTWDASITHGYGDAKTQATAAIADGVDLVAGYGGDGTQHEIANAVLGAATDLGRTTPMGILPGGTGNGFAREMGVPTTLAAAVEVLCTSPATRSIDVGWLRSIGEPQVDDRFFIQRLYIGVEPEEQTSRELKDRYGVFAYAVSAVKQHVAPARARYTVVVDGEVKEIEGSKAYVVNSGMMGTGLRVIHTYSIEDGLLDCFMLDDGNRESLIAAAERLANLSTATAGKYFVQCRTIDIDTDPDQPVWADGEYLGRTPVEIEVLPSALTVVVP